MEFEFQPWHIYSGIFVAFWMLSAYFDNFFVTALLCVAGGFGADAFRKYLAGENNDFGQKISEKVNQAPTKPLPPEPEFEDEMDQDGSATNDDVAEDDSRLEIKKPLEAFIPKEAEILDECRDDKASIENLSSNSSSSEDEAHPREENETNFEQSLEVDDVIVVEKFTEPNLIAVTDKDPLIEDSTRDLLGCKDDQNLLESSLNEASEFLAHKDDEYETKQSSLSQFRPDSMESDDSLNRQESFEASSVQKEVDVPLMGPRIPPKKIFDPNETVEESSSFEEDAVSKGGEEQRTGSLSSFPDEPERVDYDDNDPFERNIDPFCSRVEEIDESFSATSDPTLDTAPPTFEAAIDDKDEPSLEDKLSFLLEDAQRDPSDEEEEEDQQEEEGLNRSVFVEDEGDPWKPLKRQPLDSLGDSLSHPDSDDIPSRDDVSHRAVFGDDVNEDELLDEIKSEKGKSEKSESSSSSDEGPDVIDSEEEDLHETAHDIKQIPSATTNSSKLFEFEAMEENPTALSADVKQDVDEIPVVPQVDVTSRLEPEEHAQTSILESSENINENVTETANESQQIDKIVKTQPESQSPTANKSFTEEKLLEGSEFSSEAKSEDTKPFVSSDLASSVQEGNDFDALDEFLQQDSAAQTIPVLHKTSEADLKIASDFTTVESDGQPSESSKVLDDYRGKNNQNFSAQQLQFAEVGQLSLNLEEARVENLLDVDDLFPKEPKNEDRS